MKIHHIYHEYKAFLHIPAIFIIVLAKWLIYHTYHEYTAFVHIPAIFIIVIRIPPR